MTNIKHPDLTFCPPTQTSDHQLSRINIQPTGQHLAKASEAVVVVDVDVGVVDVAVAAAAVAVAVAVAVTSTATSADAAT
ncbi:unnamed protein product [Enterobius vermicularis]|uniref:Uncharacterized protein n=1 Tax=Enterobius vermicularis TaxID=51028 RepID=A0A0N4VFM7_ENTVE|nr:unnamed protein product [Enterobius vermicularis]